MGAGEAPVVIFQHEVGIHGAAGTVTNEVVSAGGPRPTIEIGAGNRHRVRRGELPGAVETSMDPLLLPWGASRPDLRVERQGVPKAREEKQAPALQLGAPNSRWPRQERSSACASLRPPALPRRTRCRTRCTRSTSAIGASAGTKNRASIWPSIWRKTGATSACFCTAAIWWSLARASRAASATRSSRSSSSPMPRDIFDVAARDITDDGKAEILVRGVIRATAPKELGLKQGTVVDREVMLVYSVRRRASRAYSARRRDARSDGKRVQGTLAFLPGAHGLDIEVRPGRAFGFTTRRIRSAKSKASKAVSSLCFLPWSGASPLGTIGTARLSFGDERCDRRPSLAILAPRTTPVGGVVLARRPSGRRPALHGQH